MIAYESFLDRFKKDNKINQDIIDEINQYGFKLDFGNKMYSTVKILINAYDNDVIMRRNIKKYAQQDSLSSDEIEYPEKGYIIGLRFLDEAIEILPEDTKVNFVFEFLENNSLEGRELYIWDYYKNVNNNYYEIKINKKLADTISNLIVEVHNLYKRQKKQKDFNL